MHVITFSTMFVYACLFIGFSKKSKDQDNEVFDHSNSFVIYYLNFLFLFK